MSIAQPSPRPWIARRETGAPVPLPEAAPESTEAPAAPAAPAAREPAAGAQPPGPGRHRRPDPEGKPPRDPEALRRLDRRWGRATPFPLGARVLAGAIAVATVVCIAIEPVPDGPEPEFRWWQNVLYVWVLASLCAAVVTLAARARVGAPLAVGAGLAMIAATVECPTSHHHQLGWWVWVQGALSLAIFLWAVAFLVADCLAYRRSVRPDEGLVPRPPTPGQSGAGTLGCRGPS